MRKTIYSIIIKSFAEIIQTAALSRAKAVEIRGKSS
jgi:hypothetical protein